MNSIGLSQNLSEEYTCSFCLNLNDTAVSLNDCGHEFHEACANRFLEAKKICPLCSEEVRDFRPSRITRNAVAHIIEAQQQQAALTNPNRQPQGQLENVRLISDQQASPVIQNERLSKITGCVICLLGNDASTSCQNPGKDSDPLQKAFDIPGHITAQLQLERKIQATGATRALGMAILEQYPNRIKDYDVPLWVQAPDGVHRMLQTYMSLNATLLQFTQSIQKAAQNCELLQVFISQHTKVPAVQANSTPVQISNPPIFTSQLVPNLPSSYPSSQSNSSASVNRGVSEMQRDFNVSRGQGQSDLQAPPNTITLTEFFKACPGLQEELVFSLASAHNAYTFPTQCRIQFYDFVSPNDIAISGNHVDRVEGTRFIFAKYIQAGATKQHLLLLLRDIGRMDCMALINEWKERNTHTVSSEKIDISQPTTPTLLKYFAEHPLFKIDLIHAIAPRDLHSFTAQMRYKFPKQISSPEAAIWANNSNKTNGVNDALTRYINLGATLNDLADLFDRIHWLDLKKLLLKGP